jgi:hypothetical protein
MIHKFIISFVIFLSTAFIFVSPTFASSGYISIPSSYGDGGLTWTPNAYTAAPYIDPFHYSTCPLYTPPGVTLTGILYNQSDDSVVSSGLTANMGCDGWMQFTTISGFTNNNEYYMIITNPSTGQTWQSACFQDTGDDNQLVGCSGNNPPVIQPVANAGINEGATYSASGLFSDSDSASWSATVNYGDGGGAQSLTLSGTSFSLNHQYNTQGTYSVTVAITDNQGSIASDSAVVTVAGEGTITTPRQYSSGALVWTPSNYTASPSIDPFHYNTCARYSPPGITLTGVLYNQSDNSMAASGLTANMGCDGWMAFETISGFQNNHKYYMVITDPSSGQTWESACFQDTGDDNNLVNCNQAPTVNAFSGSTINEGGISSISGSFTDTDSTFWSATVDYGDASGSQSLPLSGSNFSLSHVYKDNGIYTITVSVIDNQGATGTNTTGITVNNVAPTVGTINIAPSPAHINAPITASVSFTDPGVLDTHTATWNWGDGSSPQTGTVTELNGSGSVSNAHTYTSFGTYTVTLTVTDKDSASASNTGTITVVKQITVLSPAQIYISRALPVIRFDLKAEVYKDSTLVSSGQINSVAPGTNATLASIPFNSFSPVDFPAGSALKIIVSVRNACTGSILNSGNATLYYNNTPVDSRFSTTIGNVSTTYHLRNAFALSTTSGTSQNTIVVASGAKCSPFKPFGTWTVTP